MASLSGREGGGIGLRGLATAGVDFLLLQVGVEKCVEGLDALLGDFVDFAGVAVSYFETGVLVSLYHVLVVLDGLASVNHGLLSILLLF